MDESISQTSFESDEEESCQGRNEHTGRAPNGIASNNSDTFSGDKTDIRKMTLIQQYSKGRPTTNINDATMRSIIMSKYGCNGST